LAEFAQKVYAGSAQSVFVKHLFTLLFVLPVFGQIPSPSSSELLLNKADLLARNGQLPAAEAAAREFLQGHPTSADGHFLLGSILFLQSKATESLAEYTEGAKFRVPGARDLKVVGSDYVLLSDFADADKWFTKVVEWTPQDVQAWYDLARTKYNENRFEEAIDAFKKVLELDPANVKALDNLGLSYGALERNDEAISAYQRAIALAERNADKNPGPYLDLGSLLIDINREAESLPLLTQALALSPADYRVHRELGKAYLHLSELEKARAELEKAIELAPRNAPLHFMLAQVYRKQGLADKAKLETERYTALK
jgi:tetratricopeptide (TPR) repeat protein